MQAILSTTVLPLEFPINLFPQRVGTQAGEAVSPRYGVRFPINLFPQRVGTSQAQFPPDYLWRFQSIYFPNEWGH